ncbi:hypothetical protein [Arthrobacter sp. 9MFCol3.1]|nr:hypothetical protein [Arthrobacter sp. 9MFCol3.1]
MSPLELNRSQARQRVNTLAILPGPAGLATSYGERGVKRRAIAVDRKLMT